MHINDLKIKLIFDIAHEDLNKIFLIFYFILITFIFIRLVKSFLDCTFILIFVGLFDFNGFYLIFIFIVIEFSFLIILIYFVLK
jgi:hypothetical protein